MILEIEGKRVEVDDGFRTLSPQEQERTVEEIAAELEVAPQRNTGSGVMGRVNEGIASGLGGVVDAVAADFNRGLAGRALTAAGIGPVTQPFGGSASIRRGMEGAGIPLPEGEPETLGGHFARGSGEAVGFILPAGALTKAVAGLGGTAGHVGGELYRGMATRTAPAVEMMAGGGARVGGDVAAAGGEQYRPLGELAGGIVGGLGPGAAVRMTTAGRNAAPVTGTLLRAGKAAVVPFTEAGARVRASDRMRSLTADPEAAAARLAQEGPLSPAQASGEEGLMGLEKSVLAKNPKLREEFAAREREAGQTLRGDMMAPAEGRTAADARDFIEKRRVEFIRRLEQSVTEAQARADQRIAGLAPERRETANASIVREELERSLQAARVEEDRLWQAVPAATLVPTDAARSCYAALSAETSRAQQDDIPREARALLDTGGFGAQESVREMHGLYSRLREVARNSRAGTAPARNRARIADQLEEAILVDLGATGAGARGEVGRTINAARAYSHAMAETFEQGTVGRVLGRTRDGGDAMAAELTLGGTVGRGGAAGAVAVDDLRRASNAIEPPLQDYLRSQLLDRAAPRGHFSPDRADTFMRDNREVMDRMPSLAEQLAEAITASRQAGETATRAGDRVAALRDPRQSAGAALLRTQPGDEVAKGIFGSRDPIKAAEEVRRQAAQDETGNALRGLKGAVLEHLIAKASTGSFDRTGQQNLSGNALAGMLREGRTREAVARILSPEEVERLGSIAEQLQKLEAYRGTQALDAPIDDAPNSIISLLGRTMAARSGAQLGKGASGASLLTAGFASKRMQRMLESLTNDRAEALIRDAIQDRELFRALLSPLDTPAAVDRAASRLGAWLEGYAGVALADDQPDPKAEIAALLAGRRQPEEHGPRRSIVDALMRMR